MRVALILLLFAGSLGLAACATPSKARRQLAYTPAEFRTSLLERAPALPPSLTDVPFEVDRAAIERARDVIERAPLGPPRVEALVRFLTEPEPGGLGIVYDWSVTATAEGTLARRRGNCLALASLLVGLGRGLGWPIYYAEAVPRVPETKQFEDVKALSDHMIVLIVAKTVQMYVDFTGKIRGGEYDVRPIDDLRAYAHLINNLAGQRVMNPDQAASDTDWHAAQEGFELATRIEPSLGRAWNNLGIVYRHLGRIEDAREAYHRALALDAGFGSAERNLSLMETRSQGGPQLIQSAPRKP
ncbi:MAG: tetratricopeptide repeat protein [Myxococcota bacterium]